MIESGPKIEERRVIEKELKSMLHHMDEYHFEHDFIWYFKIVNFETILYNILKVVVCHFVSELFKCL